MQYANTLKSQGVTIITVAIKGNAWPTLSLLASPNNGFSVTGSDVNTLILNAFCQGTYCVFNNKKYRVFQKNRHLVFFGENFSKNFF
jgi:hypothetical protein